MKWQSAIPALALIWAAAARGLKTPKVVEASADDENAALKKRNKQLEGMMQVARNEVHRMDLVIHGNQNLQAVEDLKTKLQTVESQKTQLMQTLRQMLAKNSTKIFQKQAETAEKTQQSSAEKWAQERTDLQAQVKDANGRAEEVKDMVQTLQEQNMDLQKKVHDLQEKLTTTEASDKELSSDKANLVETMHGLMRENTGFKKALTAEEEKSSKAAKELADTKAKLAKLGKKMPKVAQAKTVARKDAPKNAHMKLKHEESGAFKIAKMNKINEYMDSVSTASGDDGSENIVEVTAQADSAPAPTQAPNVWSNDINKQVEVLAKQEGDFAKDRLQKRQIHAKEHPKEKVKGFGDWLGLKSSTAKAAGAVPKDANGLSPIDALEPDEVKQEKAAQSQQATADADDGGDGIEALLHQAKDQLNAMDRAEAQNSA